MDFELQNLLVKNSWIYKNILKSGLKKDETLTVYLEDNSYYFSQTDHDHIKEVINQIDQVIDLDFEFTNDRNNSEIDIITGDRTKYEGKLGEIWDVTAYDSWVTVEPFGDPLLPWTNNISNIIHSFLFTLGLGDPTLISDIRWDQDDTIMSLNRGDYVDWQLFPTSADYTALASVWGYENDIEVDSWSSTWVPPVMESVPLVSNQGDVIFNGATPTYFPVEGPAQIMSNQGDVIFFDATPTYF